jgi:hypothetical protein
LDRGPSAVRDDRSRTAGLRWASGRVARRCWI